MVWVFEGLTQQAITNHSKGLSTIYYGKVGSSDWQHRQKRELGAFGGYGATQKARRRFGRFCGGFLGWATMIMNRGFFRVIYSSSYWGHGYMMIHEQLWIYKDPIHILQSFPMSTNVTPRVRTSGNIWLTHGSGSAPKR